MFDGIGLVTVNVSVLCSYLHIVNTSVGPKRQEIAEAVKMPLHRGARCKEKTRDGRGA